MATGNRGRMVGKGPRPPKRSEPRPGGAALMLFRDADEPCDMVAMLRTEHDLGRLTVPDAIEVAERIAALWPSAEEVEEMENLRDEVRDGEEGLKVSEWNLKVAIEALKHLREVCGRLSNEVSACVGRLSSSLRIPTESERSEYDEKCSKVLEELNLAVSESCLRPGRDEDFRDVAARFDLLSERPNT